MDVLCQLCGSALNTAGNCTACANGTFMDAGNSCIDIHCHHCFAKNHEINKLKARLVELETKLANRT